MYQYVAPVAFEGLLGILKDKYIDQRKEEKFPRQLNLFHMEGQNNFRLIKYILKKDAS